MAVITTAMRTQVSQLYVSLFGRAPDAEGLGFWVDSLANTPGQTIAKIAQSMYDTTPARAYYPLFATPEEIVTTFYSNVLGRAPDAEGLTFWVAEFKAAATKGAFFDKLVSAVVNYTGTDAAGLKSKNLFVNKVAVAQYYGEQNGNVAGATAALAGVTDDAASVVTAKAAILSGGGTGQTFTLTTGADLSGALVGSAGTTSTTGSDTFNARTTVDSWTALDAIDGGSGNDTLNIATTATGVPVGATVTGVETIAIATTGAGYTIDTSVTGTYAGLTSLSVIDAAAGAVGVTTATTTDITTTAIGALTIDGGKAITAATTTGAVAIGGTTAPVGAITLTHAAQAASTISVLGGTSVTVTTAQTAASAAAGGTITVGSSTKAPTGAVKITDTFTSTNATNGTTSTGGAISVTGGSTVDVTQNIVVSAAAAATILTGSVTANATGGATTITGGATTTSATVTQTAAVAAVSSGTAGVGGIINGAVTINDKNAGSATLAGTISSVTLTNYGTTAIDSSALTTLTLGGTGGTVSIGRGALTATPTANTLALNTNALTGTNTITDSEAAADDGFTTINLTNTGTTVIADLVAADLTTLNIAGSGSLKLTANTLGGALTTTVVNTSTGTVELAGALAVAANYTGSNSVDKVTSGTAATGAINTGGGDDVITVSTLGTAGRINGGDGTDTLLMTAADAATATASSAFATKLTSLEKLSLAAYGAASTTVNVANLNNINYVVSAGAAASAQAQAINGFTTGGTFEQTALLGAANNVTLFGTAFSGGTADAFNLVYTATNGFANAGSVTLADVETVALTTYNSSSTAAAAVMDPNVDMTSVKSVTVAGNIGVTFANSNLGTALTSFDASGVTVGAVTYTTGALAAAATLTGGAGIDTFDASSAAVAGVTVYGNGGADVITGSATKANNLNGGDGNDSLTGGAAADTIDGNAGTNTYVFSSANVAEQAGSGTTTGVVINLGADALTATGIYTAVGAYLTNLQTSVASGTSTYLFSNESNTNASITDTLANIQNVTGTNLADYIVGSVVANTITGGTGADRMTGGSGVDTFVFVDGDGVTATASGVGLGTATIWEAGETLTFGNGLDIITDFTAGTGGDIIKGVDAGAPTAALGVAAGATTGLAANTTYYLSGTYVQSTGVFTIAANGAGADTLIIEGAGTAQTVNPDMILLVGVNSANLVAANFIA